MEVIKYDDEIGGFGLPCEKVSGVFVYQYNIDTCSAPPFVGKPSRASEKFSPDLQAQVPPWQRSGRRKGGHPTTRGAQIL
jgi:hypothetical protein